MERITIHATSAESAQALHQALRKFRTELVESDRGLRLEIQLERGFGEALEVLYALEQYVTKRARVPAQVELDGFAYTMHPDASQ